MVKKCFLNISLLTLLILSLFSLTACKPDLNIDRREENIILKDKSIDKTAKLSLYKNKTLRENTNINILTYNNSILLTGQAKNNTFKKQAEEIIRKNTKINKVYNKITIGKPASIEQKSKDSWITTQIKTNFIIDPDLGNRKVKIITENNIVYLMGILTEPEELKSVQIASKTTGVKSVVTIIDTI